MRCVAVGVAVGIAFAAVPAFAESSWCVYPQATAKPWTMDAAIAEVYKACSVGDIIPVAARSSEAIARVCDFGKQIYLAPDGTVVCSLGPLKPTKR